MGILALMINQSEVSIDNGYPGIDQSEVSMNKYEPITLQECLPGIGDRMWASKPFFSPQDQGNMFGDILDTATITDIRGIDV